MFKLSREFGGGHGYFEVRHYNGDGTEQQIKIFERLDRAVQYVEKYKGTVFFIQCKRNGTKRHLALLRTYT